MFGERQKFDCFLHTAMYMAVNSGGVKYDLEFVGIGGQFDMWGAEDNWQKAIGT